MKKYLAILFLFLNLVISAQEINEKFRFGLYYDLNIEPVSAGKLNQFLTNNDYYPVAGGLNSSSLGFTVRSLENPSIVSVVFKSGNSLFDNTKINSSLFYYGFGLDYAYDIIKSEDWLAAPYICIRLNNYELTTASKNRNSTLSGNYLEEGCQMKQRTNLSVGLQANRKVKIYFIDAFLGLKGGYNYSFLPDYWNNSRGKKLSNIPGMNLSGFYVGFCGIIEFNMNKINSKAHQKSN